MLPNVDVSNTMVIIMINTCCNHRKLRYGKYTIIRKWVTSGGKSQPDEFEYYHDDYDGPGDLRAGNGHTVKDCKDDIDDLQEDSDYRD